MASLSVNYFFRFYDKTRKANIYAHLQQCDSRLAMPLQGRGKMVLHCRNMGILACFAIRA